ncbi:MAG TPA: PadR family transcriptional regulator [Firmicutes bacterium]|nr:PadR family transcriptional regulator [Bacillota bacterium]
MDVDKSLMTGTTTLLVLSLLRDGENYGYGIISELARRSDETFLLKEGTLYPILHGLENNKCVVSYIKEAENGRQRKYYRLTKKGLKLLERKTQEWCFFAKKVDEVVLGTMHATA